MTMTLTPDKLKVIDSWDRKTFDGQKKVMKGNSANDVARLLGLPAIGYEWLHMIAFSLGGHEGTPQVAKNLVLGTEAANTAMMSLEGFVHSLISKGRYPEAQIVVMRTAPVPKECAWFAESIQYTIKLSRPPGAPIYIRESFNPLLMSAPAFSVEQMARQIRDRELKSAPPPRPVSDTMRKPGSRPGRRL
jgi:hypothetical protein